MSRFLEVTEWNQEFLSKATGVNEEYLRDIWEKSKRYQQTYFLDLDDMTYIDSVLQDEVPIMWKMSFDVLVESLLQAKAGLPIEQVLTELAEVCDIQMEEAKEKSCGE